jgi:hypothetical protein
VCVCVCRTKVTGGFVENALVLHPLSGHYGHGKDARVRAQPEEKGARLLVCGAWVVVVGRLVSPPPLSNFHKEKGMCSTPRRRHVGGGCALRAAQVPASRSSAISGVM